MRDPAQSVGHPYRMLSLTPSRERRDLMMEALERHLAGEYRSVRPNGGHHVWVQLVRPIDERAMGPDARPLP